MKIHLAWNASFHWASTTNNIFRLYHIIFSRGLKSIEIETYSSSHLVSNQGGIYGHLQNSKINQVSLSHNLNLLPKVRARVNHTQIRICS